MNWLIRIVYGIIGLICTFTLPAAVCITFWIIGAILFNLYIEAIVVLYAVIMLYGISLLSFSSWPLFVVVICVIVRLMARRLIRV